MPLLIKGWPTLDGPYRKAMARLGSCIGRCPLPFLVIPVIVSAAFVYPFVQGISDYRRLAITRAGAIELFTPSQSRADRDRRLIMRAFPDGGYFRDRTVITPGLFIVLVSAAQKSITNQSILDDYLVNEYRALRGHLENLNATAPDGRIVSLRSLCKESISANQSITAASSTSGNCQQDALLTLWTLHRSGLLPVFTYPYIKIDLPPSGDSKILETLAIPNSMYIGPLFGGVKTDERGRIQYVKYARMIFRLPIDTDLAVIDRLAMSFSAYLDQYRSDPLSISYWVSQKYARDMQLISKRVVRLLPALILFLLTFALVSCCMKDCILSKPWLAVGGLISAGLGLQVGFAVLFVVDVDLIEIAMIVPFLVLSIGLDDTFVMLNVWRSTDPRLSVEKRMAVVFEEAAVSITITSVTDVAAFIIGLSSVFPAVRIFCAFCASALFAVFLYQLTFFGACMTYSGRMEAEGRHCLTFRKVKKRENADHESLLDKIFCSTMNVPDIKSPPTDSSSIRRPWPVLFFKNRFADWLHRPMIKLGVGISYIFYIATSVFFLVAFLRQGLQVSNLVPYDSSTHDYLTLYERYFSKCSTSAEVVILATEPFDCDIDQTRSARLARIDYGRRDIQRLLVDWALSFENTDFSYKIDFWLYEYLLYRQKQVNQQKRDEAEEDEEFEFEDAEYDEDLEENFVSKLETDFLSQNRYRKYIDHLTFDQCRESIDHDRFGRSADKQFDASINHYSDQGRFDRLISQHNDQNQIDKSTDHNQIDRSPSPNQQRPTSRIDRSDKRYINASRFYVELANMGFENRSAAMRLLREKADQVPAGFAAYVFDVSFPLAEQYDAVLPGVLYDVAVGVGCMLAVACLFVPNFQTCLCIAFTVFSINIGVLGYMAIWRVNLDIISTITILLSIGFSVDYTSHVAYHFFVSGRGGEQQASIESKVAEALETAGWPILQSSLSMMVGVVTVLGVRAYISDTFVKTVLLVMLIGVYHALIVLPVLLSVVSTAPKIGKSEKSMPPIKPQRRRQPRDRSTLESTKKSIDNNIATTISSKSMHTKIGVDGVYRLPAKEIPRPIAKQQKWWPNYDAGQEGAVTVDVGLGDKRQKTRRQMEGNTRRESNGDCIGYGPL